jgi:hypothetical protein
MIRFAEFNISGLERFKIKIILIIINYGISVNSMIFYRNAFRHNFLIRD